MNKKPFSEGLFPDPHTRMVIAFLDMTWRIISSWDEMKKRVEGSVNKWDRERKELVSRYMVMEKWGMEEIGGENERKYRIGQRKGGSGWIRLRPMFPKRDFKSHLRVEPASGVLWNVVFHLDTRHRHSVNSYRRV